MDTPEAPKTNANAELSLREKETSVNIGSNGKENGKKETKEGKLAFSALSRSFGSKF